LTPAALRQLSARKLLPYVPFLLGLVLFVLALIMVARITVSSHRLQWEAWALSEWLINYSQGFVRRGLGGEIMRRVWSPENLFAGVNAVLFVLFLLFSLGLSILFALAAGTNRAFLLIAAFPGGVVTMAAQRDFFYRKEMLFHVVLLLIAVLVAAVPKDGSDRLRRMAAALVAAVTAAAFVALPLIHEAFLFLAAPPYLYVLYVASRYLHARWLKRLILPLALVPMALFGVAIVFHGEQGVATGIWESYPIDIQRMIVGKGDADVNLARGGVVGLEWTIGGAFAYSYRIVQNGFLWYWAVLLAFVALCLIIVSDEIARDDQETRGAAGGVIIVFFALSLPLYFIGIDWGRWIAAVSVGALVAILLSRRTGIWPGWAAALALSWRRLPPTLFWAVVGVSLTLRVPECCLRGQAGGRSGVFGLSFALP
jgi:hypothetical protein